MCYFAGGKGGVRIVFIEHVPSKLGHLKEKRMMFMGAVFSKLAGVRAKRRSECFGLYSPPSGWRTGSVGMRGAV